MGRQCARIAAQILWPDGPLKSLVGSVRRLFAQLGPAQSFARWPKNLGLVDQETRAPSRSRVGAGFGIAHENPGPVDPNVSHAHRIVGPLRRLRYGSTSDQQAKTDDACAQL